MTLHELKHFLEQEFPQGTTYGTVQNAGDGWAEMRLPVDEQHLRPGGTVSGPAMMGLADVAMYAALLTRIGKVPLAVTANLNINFLRKPEAGKAIVARATVLKAGRSLAFGEVSLFSEGGEAPVAHATLSYAIPAPRP